MAVTNIDGTAAEDLIARGGVRLLDVRTPHEHAVLGHLPGATLLPVDLIVSAPAVLDAADAAPVLVYCEHGIRSRHAAAVLAQAGFSDVLNLTHGMAAWRGAREFGDAPVAGPSPWLLQHANFLRPESRVLDVACGAGRHALPFASAGFPTRAVDRDGQQIERLRASAGALELSLQAEIFDLERPDADLGDAAYDVVLVVHYLHRPLFPALRRALAPGGLLIYETYLEAHAARYGRPSNPEDPLKPGELATLAAPLEIVKSFEGESNGRIVSAIVARRVNGAPG